MATFTPCTPSGGPLPARKPDLDALASAGIEVPNLDELCIDPGTYEAASSLFGLLAAYSDTKARAMRFRLAGDVEAALACERACDSTYKRLPEWARW